MHTDQLFPTYLIQPGVLPPPPHTAGRTPKDPRGFQTCFSSSEPVSASILARRVDVENPWGLFEQLFSRLASPVSGQPQSILHRPRSIANCSLSTFARSKAPPPSHQPTAIDPRKKENSNNNRGTNA
jgi:hypothetical protein